MDLDESCGVVCGVKDLGLGGGGSRGGKPIRKLSGRLPWDHVYHYVSAGLICFKFYMSYYRPVYDRQSGPYHSAHYHN